MKPETMKILDGITSDAMGEQEYTCSRCRHWSAQKEECHINPPQVFVIITNPITAWPKSKANDFCGKFAWRDDE